MINFESIEPFVIGLMAFAFLMAVMLGIARLAERLSSGLHVFGNVVTGPVSTVTLAVAREPGRSATGSTTSVAAVNGVASVTSETLTAGAAAASQSVLQQSPTTGTAGQALSTAVKVAVTDAFGNVVTSDTSTVAIAVASGPGGFAVGSTTSVAAVNGVATFSNLILDTAGSYTLSLSDGDSDRRHDGDDQRQPGGGQPARIEAVANERHRRAGTGSLGEGGSGRRLRQRGHQRHARP